MDEAPLAPLAPLALLDAGDDGRVALAVSTRRFREALLPEQLDGGDEGRCDGASEFDLEDCLETDLGRIPSLEERDAVSEGVVIGGNKDSGAMPAEGVRRLPPPRRSQERLARKGQPRPYLTWKALALAPGRGVFNMYATLWVFMHSYRP